MTAMLMNEKIKASEVRLIGLNGEELGIVATTDALSRAKAEKADLVCLNLLSSPPPCQLMAKGAAKQKTKAAKNSISDEPLKTKEIRLTAAIEEHDYDTKLRQCIKLLQSQAAVQLVVKVQGKESAKAKECLERMIDDLKLYGSKKTGIQVSGKQVSVQILPLS